MVQNHKMLSRTSAVIAALMLIPLMSFVVQEAAADRLTQPVFEASGVSDTPRLFSVCKFHQVKEAWEGSCGKIFEQTPILTISPAKTITTGIWRRDAAPAAIWAGDITDSGYPNAPIEIEIYKGGSGVFRTEYGWFPISGFAIKSKTLSFKTDTSHEIPPNGLDRQIVQRAAAILSTESAWNRADTRKCNSTDVTWSIYCAVQLATVEVTGAFHHRRPALELVRQIVDERSAGRNYNHRLMDYNNDPSTKLEDIRSLFAEALTRINLLSVELTG